MNQADAFQFLSPEDMQKLQSSVGLDQKQQMLEHQLAQAYALRDATGGHHTTALGAALGGVGQAINAYNGKQQVDKTQAQQQQGLNQQQAAYSAIVDALRRSRGQMAGPTQPSQDYDTEPATPMSEDGSY